MVNIFGPLFIPLMLEDDVERVLRKWMGTYQAEVMRRAETHRLTLPDDMLDRTSELALRPVKSWNPVDAVDQNWPDDQLPAVIVAAGRTEGDPDRDGDGTHRVPFRLEVAVVVSSTARRRARRNAAGQAIAVTWVLAHKLRQESDHVDAIKYRGGLPGVVRGAAGPEDSTAASYQVAFDIVVPDVFADFAGPAEPIPDGELPDESGPTIADPVSTTVGRVAAGDLP